MLLVGVSFILQLFLKRNCPNQDEGAELAVFSKLFWEARPLLFAIVPDPLSSLLHHFVFSFRASLLRLAHTKEIMLSLPISNCPVCLSTMPSVLISELQHGAEFDAFWKLNVAQASLRVSSACVYHHLSRDIWTALICGLHGLCFASMYKYLLTSKF